MFNLSIIKSSLVTKIQKERGLSKVTLVGRWILDNDYLFGLCLEMISNLVPIGFIGFFFCCCKNWEPIKSSRFSTLVSHLYYH